MSLNIHSNNIAVIWCGDIRFYEQTYYSYKANILNLIKKGYAIDLYASVYKSSQTQKFRSLYDPIALEEQDRKSVEAHIRAQYGDFADESKYNFWPESRLMDCICMHYKMKRAYSFFEMTKNKDYKYVIRMRDKIIFEEQLNDNILNKIQTSYDIFIPQFGDWRGGINDLFAIGFPEAMKKYFSIIDNYDKYLTQGCYFHFENLLGWHLIYNRMNLIREPFDLYIYGKAQEDTIKKYTKKSP